MIRDFCQIATSGDTSGLLVGVCSFASSDEGRNFMGFIASFLGAILAIKRLVINLFFRRIAMIGVFVFVGVMGFILKDRITPSDGWFSPSNRSADPRPSRKSSPLPRKRTTPTSPGGFWGDDYPNDVIKGRR